MWDRSEPMRLVTKKKSYKLRIILWPKQRLKSLLSNRLSEKVFLKENEMKFPCRRVLQNPWYLILIRLGFLRKVFSEIFLKLTRGSDLQVYYKKAVLKSFKHFTEKSLYMSLFWNKVAGLQPQTSFKNRLLYRCFLIKFCQIF